MKINRLLIIFFIVGAILLIPFIAMQFSNDVVWTSSDFIIMGALLTITGLGIDLVLRKIPSTRNRILLCGAVLFLFFLIWAELAVGVFGTPFAGS